MTVTPTLYLVSRSNSNAGVINGVTAVLINLDATAQTTSAQRIAKATLAVNNAFGSDVADGAPAVYDSDYFDTIVTVSDLSAGPLATLKTSYVFQDSAYGGISAVQAATA